MWGTSKQYNSCLVHWHIALHSQMFISKFNGNIDQLMCFILKSTSFVNIAIQNIEHLYFHQTSNWLQDSTNQMFSVLLSIKCESRSHLVFITTSAVVLSFSHVLQQQLRQFSSEKHSTQQIGVIKASKWLAVPGIYLHITNLPFVGTSWQKSITNLVTGLTEGRFTQKECFISAALSIANLQNLQSFHSYSNSQIHKLKIEYYHGWKNHVYFVLCSV